MYNMCGNSAKVIKVIKVKLLHNCDPGERRLKVVCMDLENDWNCIPHFLMVCETLQYHSLRVPCYCWVTSSISWGFDKTAIPEPMIFFFVGVSAGHLLERHACITFPQRVYTVSHFEKKWKYWIRIVRLDMYTEKTSV